jgi:cytoplasmic iron level regulating protein YaaA (DUF328/UPF0246 family)
MLDETQTLVRSLRRKSAKSIGELMSISSDLAKLNKERYTEFSEDFTNANSKQAILAFDGDVYSGLDNQTLLEDDLEWAQDHVRILSGLYGVLRPNDRMQPYRLEMGTKLKTRRGTNLYKYWGDKITNLLNEDIESHSQKFFFNLASNEYFKSVKVDKLNGELYSANFYERRDGEYKFISFTAKKARGWLTRYIIDNRIDTPEAVKDFNGEGFHYLKKLSSDREFIFVRKGPGK